VPDRSSRGTGRRERIAHPDEVASAILLGTPLTMAAVPLVLTALV
jgi:hypothetical protein